MEGSRIPPNVSQQYLVRNDDNQATSSSLESQFHKRTDDNNASLRNVTVKEWTAVLVLCFVNLINYMDRFTIAGEFNLCFVVDLSSIFI